MVKEIADKWVEALRSGNYEQGDGALCSVTEVGEKLYCCLGVLTHIYITEHNDTNFGFTPLRERREADKIAYVSTCGDVDTQYLPTAVRKWAGMKTEDGTLPNDIHGEDTLAGLNDCGSEFSDIADIIKQYQAQL